MRRRTIEHDIRDAMKEVLGCDCWNTPHKVYRKGGTRGYSLTASGLRKLYWLEEYRTRPAGIYCDQERVSEEDFKDDVNSKFPSDQLWEYRVLSRDRDELKSELIAAMRARGHVVDVSTSGEMSATVTFKLLTEKPGDAKAAIVTLVGQLPPAKLVKG